MPRFIPVSFLCLLLLPVYGCGSSTPEEALREADALIAEGDPRSAMIELKNTLQDSPDSGAVRARLGDVHVMVGDYPSALKEYERALDLGVDTEPLRVSILKVKNRLGRFTEVIGELKDRADLTPATAVLLGEALLVAGDLDRAEPFLRQGSELAAGAIGLAQIAARRGDRDAALAEAARAIGLSDVATETVLAKGELELGFGLFDDAIGSFQTASAMPAGQLPGLLGVARGRLGKNDLDGALAEIDGVLSAAPGALPAHYLKAAILVQKEDLEGAEASVLEVQKVAPDHTPSMYLMALIKQKQGQISQAEDQIRRFVAREPNNAQGLKLLASMLAEEGKFREVVDVLGPASESIEDAELLSMLGNAQLRTGRSNDATVTLQKAVQIAPDAAPVRNQLALSMVAGGDNSAAEELLQQSLKTDSEQLENEYLLAMLRLQKRDVAGATEVIDRLMDANPDLPLPYHLRGLLRLLEQDIKKAETEFRLALGKDAGFLPAAQALAQLAIQRDDLAGARAVMADVLKKTPDDPSALVASAELASRDGDLEETEALLTRAAGKNPKAVPPRIVLARLYFSQGRVEDAERMVAEGLAIAPIQFDLLILQAERALVTGDRATAEGAADKLQEQLGGEANNGALIAALGSIQLRLGRNTQAKENLERALELLGPNNAGLLASLVQVHLVENDAGLARARFDALRDTGAKGVEIDLLSANVLRAEGKTAEATKIYGELIAQGSRDAVGQQFGTFMQSGKRTEAAETLEAWLKDHPDDQAVMFNLATLYMEQGSDKAIPLYESMIDSKNPVVLNNLAWLYHKKSDPRALETARLALAAAPDSSDVLDTLGWILIGTGAAEEGVMHLRRAVQLKPNEPTLLYHLGVGLARLGSAGEARITLQRALTSGDFGDREAAQKELDALSE